jgi:hypothetical protein
VGDSPLQPRNPVAVAQKKRLLAELHDDFKASVTSARGDKLRHADAYAYAYACGERKDRKARAEALFDGSVYAGKTAVRLGLADAVYEQRDATLKARFGEDVRVREVKARLGVFDRLQALQEAGAAAHAAALWREVRVEATRAASPPALAGPGSLIE